LAKVTPVLLGERSSNNGAEAGFALSLEHAVTASMPMPTNVGKLKGLERGCK
jgi:hypothetical protein